MASAAAGRQDVASSSDASVRTPGQHHQDLITSHREADEGTVRWLAGENSGGVSRCE